MPISPSPDFAYLIGVIAGDGCITRSGNVFKLEISCDEAYPELIREYQELVERVIGIAPSLYKVKDKHCYRLVITAKHLPEMQNMPAGGKVKSGFTIPEWVFESKECIRALVRGLVETDGAVQHVYRNGAYSHVHFVASNSVIMGSFVRATHALGYSFRVQGERAILSHTNLAKEFVAELGILKSKEYRY